MSELFLDSTSLTKGLCYMDLQRIHIIYAIDAKEKTKDDLLKEHEIFKIQHPNWQKSTFSEFLSFQKEWKHDKYSFDVEDIAYFLDKQKAIDFISNNRTDINEAGAYPFAALLSVPIGTSYARAHTRFEDVMLFEYDPLSDQYAHIAPSSELYQANDFGSYLTYALCGIVPAAH